MCWRELVARALHREKNSKKLFVKLLFCFLLLFRTFAESINNKTICKPIQLLSKKRYLSISISH